MHARDAGSAPVRQESPGSLDELSQALRCLPGVGPKAAQRMALHLMQHDRDGANRLARALADASRSVQHCERCNTLTESAFARYAGRPSATHRSSVSSKRRPIC